MEPTPTTRVHVNKSDKERIALGYTNNCIATLEVLLRIPVLSISLTHLYHINITSKFREESKIQFCESRLIGALAPSVVASDISAVKIITSARPKRFDSPVFFVVGSKPKKVTK